MHTAGNSFLLLLLVGTPSRSRSSPPARSSADRRLDDAPVNVALLPRLSYLVERSPDQATAWPVSACSLMTAVGVAFGIAVGLLAPWLVDLLFGLPEYEPAVDVLRIMALIIPMIVLNSALISQSVLPYSLERGLLAVTVSSMVINLLLVLAVAPRFGAAGVACVAVFAESYLLAGLLLVLRRQGIRPISLRHLKGHRYARGDTGHYRSPQPPGGGA